MSLIGQRKTIVKELCFLFFPYTLSKVVLGKHEMKIKADLLLVLIHLNEIVNVKNLHVQCNNMHRSSQMLVMQISVP